MKTIYLKDYNPSMGTLIDVRNPLEYQQKHVEGSINIYYEKLMYNPTMYLDKEKPYFLICNKGTLSERTTRYLTYLGYNVTKVLY